MDYFEFIINGYTTFLKILNDLKNESTDTLNKYGGF